MVYGTRMKLACVSVAYCEQRLIAPFIQSMQDRVDEIVVLNSTKPWNGDTPEKDNTAPIARSLGATVLEYDWATEEDQRNAGQDYCSDYDWIIVLDPDEFLLEADWQNLYRFLEVAPMDAYVTNLQHTYYKKGVVDPVEDYKQIIAVKPRVRFVDKRVVDSPWSFAPTELHHMSWRRSDEEMWRKINSYGHAKEFDTLKWFSEVWLSDQTENVHPLTPPSLRKVMPVILPEELEKLGL